MTSEHSPLSLVVYPGEGEYSSLVEPLQSTEHLVVKGVRSNAMSREETHDAAAAIGEMRFTTGDAIGDTYTRAQMLLTLAGAIADVKLLDESPTLLGTAEGSLARGVSIQRLKDLETAIDIERLSPSSENIQDIFNYRYNANTTVAKHPRTNIARILHALERSQTLSKQDYDMLHRTVGHVLHQQLVRTGLAK